jgi:hypothetical protein
MGWAMRDRSCSVLGTTGLIAWGALIAIILTLSAVTGAERSVIPLYIDASLDFWAGRIPDTDYRFGYYYLPVSQILFAPFAWAGLHLGGTLWRLLAFGLLTFAVHTWSNLLFLTRKCDATALMLVLLIPGVAGALRVGQFEAPMWAFIFLGFAAIARERWWFAAVALTLALALKPTAIVPMLLAGVLWPAAGIRLLPLMLVILCIPFFFADREFVFRLYASLLDRITGATQETGLKFRGLFNMLEFFGVMVPYWVRTGVRLATALGTLGLGWVAVRRLNQTGAAFIVFALSAIYLVLFNPRVEGLDYIALSLVVAPLATRAVEKRASAAAALIAVCMLVAVPGLWPLTVRTVAPWLMPSLAILTLFLIVVPRALDAGSWREYKQ